MSRPKDLGRIAVAKDGRSCVASPGLEEELYTRHPMPNSEEYVTSTSDPELWIRLLPLHYGGTYVSVAVFDDDGTPLDTRQVATEAQASLSDQPEV